MPEVDAIDFESIHSVVFGIMLMVIEVLFRLNRPYFHSVACLAYSAFGDGKRVYNFCVIRLRNEVGVVMEVVAVAGDDDYVRLVRKGFES